MSQSQETQNQRPQQQQKSSSYITSSQHLTPKYLNVAIWVTALRLPMSKTGQICVAKPTKLPRWSLNFVQHLRPLLLAALEDVSLIAQPVLDSLKEITEKPRRVKELNELIELKKAEINVSKEALGNLVTVTRSDGTQELTGSLLNLTNKWQKRLDDAQGAITLADIQLKGLAGDQPLSESIYSALIKFAKGRGLTIVMAIAVAWIVWFGVRLLLKVYLHTMLDKRQKGSRTRYRVAKYSVQATVDRWLCSQCKTTFAKVYQRSSFAVEPWRCARGRTRNL